MIDFILFFCSLFPILQSFAVFLSFFYCCIKLREDIMRRRTTVIINGEVSSAPIVSPISELRKLVLADLQKKNKGKFLNLTFTEEEFLLSGRIVINIAKDVNDVDQNTTINSINKLTV